MSKYKQELAELNSMLEQGLDVYRHYYPLVTGRPLGQLKAKMISPFLRGGEREKDPSFSIFLNASKGVVYFKDHGVDKAGSHWQFVMDLFGVDFHEAIEKVKSEILNIGSNGYTTKVLTNHLPKPSSVKNTRSLIIPTLRGFNDFDINYWKKSWISEKTLHAFHCSASSQFQVIKEEKSFIIREREGHPIYNIHFPETGHNKMLQPFADPQYKWTSNLKADEDFFGLDLVPAQCEHLFIIGGNSDAMAFHENIQLPVIALASESANLTQKLFNFLRTVAKHIWIFYDNDKQGYRKAERFKEEFGLRSLNHLLYPFEVKDFRQLLVEKPLMFPEFKKNLLSDISK